MTLALSALVPLRPEHQAERFVSGDLEIDRFLREHAAAEQKLQLSQVYVSTNQQNEVVAYFTLSPLAIRVEPALLSAMGTPAVPYPSIGGFLLGRLGVHQSLQRQGIGEALVMRAAQLAKMEATRVGGVFLAVDPKTDKLVEWYAKQGFIRLGARTRRMILSLRAVP